jgi:hypothetical protein
MRPDQFTRTGAIGLRGFSLTALVLIILQLSSGSALGQSGICAGMTPGQLTSSNGFVPFPSDSLWNTDISSASTDPASDNIINYIGTAVTVHPDFGSGKWAGQFMGIPYQIVSGSQAEATIQLQAFGDESEPGPMPVPPNALIEGYPKPGNGDRHVLVLEKDGCWLYELYNSHRVNRLRWKADSTAVWDMTSNEQRPYTWTSADAAGLPIFAGLVRYDEVAAGAINHALRFTVPVTRQAFTAPASHWASSVTDSNAPPMGTRLRLKASFDISGFSAQNQVILTALKKYGMILADNGSAIYISGAPDNRWNNDDLGQLKTLVGSDFEVVQMGAIYSKANPPPIGSAPVINSFTPSPASIGRGQSTTLNWDVTNANYSLISTIGPVRGTSISVSPKKTTTYTLYATNQYGRTTGTAVVMVHLH